MRAKVGDATYWKNWHAMAGFWAKVLATCWRWTSTSRAMAWSGALQVLQSSCAQRQTWRRCPSVDLFPQVLLNVRLPEGADWRSMVLLARETQAVEEELGAAGRVLIRASGTSTACA